MEREFCKGMPNFLRFRDTVFYAAFADSLNSVNVSSLHIYSQMEENMSIYTWLRKGCDND